MIRPTTIRSAARLGTFATLAVALTGCTQGNNVGTLGDDVRLSALTDSLPRPETAIRDDAPSLTSLGRAEWGTTAFVVPVDGVAAKPNYTSLRQRTDATARQRGDFPTAMTALELDGDTRAARWREAGLSPFWAVWDLVSLPYHAYQHPPTREIDTQLGWYARSQPQTPRSVPSETRP